MNNKGVTLVELLIVLAIIGILAMIGIPAYVGQQTSAERTEAYANLENLRLLEEQFFADNSRYTISLGTAAKDSPGNVNIIRTGNGDPANALSGFRPGNATSFSYWIVTNQQITNAGATPPATAALVPCFVAYASGNTRTRVDGDVFAVDCNNIRNF